MDVRHIKEVPPMIEDGSGLTRIFNLQTLLVENYIKIENLPPYPVNLSIREDQKLIKDFVGRVIEELAEAYESYLMMLETYENPPEGKVAGLEEYMAPLQNFNEELADALHFFVELFIYIDITEEDIKEFLKRRLSLLNLKEAFWYDGSDPLESLIQLSIHSNVHDHLKDKEYLMAYKVIENKDLKDEFLTGGRSISPYHAATIADLSWKITYHLSIARNFLKNKPWKKSEMTTDKKRFYNSIMEAWLTMFRLFEFVGLNSSAIFHIYFKKNCINQFRINSNY